MDGVEQRLKHARHIFAEAPFIAELGYDLVRIEPGFAETRLAVEPRHCQHHGFVHAGVQATMADHSAGCAATPSR